MNEHPHNGHLSAEQVQALLDGRLSPEARRRAEDHLAGCAACAADLSTWGVLFRELEDLPVLAPSVGFADRVLAGVQVPERLPFAARVKARVSDLLPAGRGSHPRGSLLQDFVEGVLSPRHAARIRSHLDGCGVCAADVGAWRALVRRLDQVGHVAPSEGFSDAVMARVQLRAPVAVTAPVSEWKRALARVGRLVPHTRQAWAAMSGVAVTPMATAGLLLWTLFTHPTLTPGALASFAWWKASALVQAAWQSLATTLVESTGLFEVYSFVGSLAASPALLVATFLALSVGTVSAAWILYRNLVATHPTDGRYAHASIS